VCFAIEHGWGCRRRDRRSNSDEMRRVAATGVVPVFRIDGDAVVCVASNAASFVQCVFPVSMVW